MLAGIIMVASCKTGNAQITAEKFTNCRYWLRYCSRKIYNTTYGKKQDCARENILFYFIGHNG